MAQFVGGESKYNGILSGFGEIYKENGLLGKGLKYILLYFAVTKIIQFLLLVSQLRLSQRRDDSVVE